MSYGEPVFGTVKEKNPVVLTKNGKVMGENRNGIAIFRGIPYGDDCGGDHRFLPPFPVKNWEGVRDCTKNGHYCKQIGTSIGADPYMGGYFSGNNPEALGAFGEEQGEDCLILNLLTPGIDDKKRPVAVYIHGGGWSTNSGSLILGADELAREEDLVLVGITHRLAAFGYLYLGDLDEKYADSGNAGMLDLVAALEWIRDNIASFGGDPEKVTLFGESGGGMKINTLLAMKRAKGLFRAAILESGTSVVDAMTTEKATEMTRDLLKTLGIEEDHLEKLETVPADDIVKATAKYGLGGFCPVADGRSFPYKEGKIRTWEGSEDVPVMLGSSEEEIALFSSPEALNVTDDTILDLLLKADNNMSGDGIVMTKADAEHILEVFRSVSRKSMTADHIYQRIQSLGGFLGSGSWYLALSRAKNASAPTYFYTIRRETVLPGDSGKAFAWHTAELPWVMRMVPHPEDEQISRLMAHVWAAFIRTGDPSVEGLEWPPFTEDKRLTMIFDDESRVESDPNRELREALESIGVTR